MAQAIIATQTVSGNSPKTRTRIEKSGQTFLAGVPVMIDADGGIKEWTGNVADMIAGISSADGANLATTGKDAPGAMQPYLGLGATLTLPQAVPNQPNAKMIPIGAPFNDGRTPFFAANPDTVFEGQVGPAQTTVITDEGVSYGLTKDADGHWYIDRTKTAANSVLTIQRLHPLDGPKAAGRVLFTFKPASVSIIA